MKFSDLSKISGILPLCDGGDSKREIKGIYCCDLLSHALAHAPSGCAWVTVMVHENSLVVALQRKISCIIFSEGMTVPDSLIECAKKHGIAVATSRLPTFETALALQKNGLEEG